MIEFKGSLTGEAKKYLQRKVAKNLSWLFFFGITLVLAFFLSISGKDLEHINLISFCIWPYSVVPILRCLSASEKEIVMPNKITIFDGIITATTNEGDKVRKIEDVKLVREFDDFYALSLRKTPVISYFICQKDLLTKGTEEEFRALFKGKIERISAYDKQLRDSNERVICILLSLVGIGALIYTLAEVAATF